MVFYTKPGFDQELGITILTTVIQPVIYLLKILINTKRAYGPLKLKIDYLT